jgi:hypothetical protein
LEANVEALNVWAVVDGVGRQFLGEWVAGPDYGTMTLKNPILMAERPTTPPQVELTFMPVSAVINLEEIEVRWTTRFRAPADLVSKYFDISTKLKAARSGIQIAQSIPKGLVRVK